MKTIEEYALDLVINHAQSGVDDDIDEDGDLANDEDHDAARALAQRIVNGMEANPAALIAMATGD